MKRIETIDLRCRPECSTEKYAGQERHFFEVLIGTVIVAQQVITKLPVQSLETEPIQRALAVREAARDGSVLAYGYPIQGVVMGRAILEADQMLLRPHDSAEIPIPVAPFPVHTMPPDAGPVASVFLFFRANNRLY